MIKFLCDEMLTGLGRWLRIAGYDTWIVEPGARDKDIVVLVKSSKRWFLTCDSALAQRLKEYQQITLLASSDIDACVKALNQKLDIDWLSHAFQRCSVCNTNLKNAYNSQALKLNIDLDKDQAIYYCSQCDKIYWEGSHVKHMRQKLTKFQSLK